MFRDDIHTVVSSIHFPIATPPAVFDRVLFVLFPFLLVVDCLKLNFISFFFVLFFLTISRMPSRERACVCAFRVAIRVRNQIKTETGKRKRRRREKWNENRESSPPSPCAAAANCWFVWLRFIFIEENGYGSFGLSVRPSIRPSIFTSFSFSFLAACGCSPAAFFAHHRIEMTLI